MLLGCFWNVPVEWEVRNSQDQHCCHLAAGTWPTPPGGIQGWHDKMRASLRNRIKHNNGLILCFYLLNAAHSIFQIIKLWPQVFIIKHRPQVTHQWSPIFLYIPLFFCIHPHFSCIKKKTLSNTAFTQTCSVGSAAGTEDRKTVAEIAPGLAACKELDRGLLAIFTSKHMLYPTGRLHTTLQRPHTSGSKGIEGHRIRNLSS